MTSIVRASVVEVRPGDAPAVRKLGGRVGAEILGVSLRDADDATAGWVRDRLHEYKVLGFREQHLTAQEQAAFVGRLGIPTVARPVTAGAKRDYGLLIGKSLPANEWHTDASFVLTPPRYACLRGLEFPDYGGDTLFANAAAAYADLQVGLRQLADTLFAIHANAYDYIGRDVKDVPAEAVTNYANLERNTHVARHPLARRHSVTGEPLLFLGEWAQRFDGYNMSDSAHLMAVFQDHITRPENVARWVWRPGDVVLWDEEAAQHYAPNDYDGLTRRVERITVAGTVPVGVNGERSVALRGDAEDYGFVDCEQAA